jgi:hypothetical protein
VGALGVGFGSTVAVEAGAASQLGLVRLGPNPGSGPVRLEFALGRAAAIGIDVFDVQGRRIASPANGVWPAGTHAVDWDGRGPDGRPAPAGVYLLRYVHPGGEDQRRLVQLR